MYSYCIQVLQYSAVPRFAIIHLTKKMPFLFDFSSMYVYGVQTQWSKVES